MASKKDRIVELAGQDKTHEEIAEEVGCSRPYVSSTLKNHDPDDPSLSPGSIDFSDRRMREVFFAVRMSGNIERVASNHDLDEELVRTIGDAMPSAVLEHMEPLDPPLDEPMSSEERALDYYAPDSESKTPWFREPANVDHEELVDAAVWFVERSPSLGDIESSERAYKRKEKLLDDVADRHLFGRDIVRALFERRHFAWDEQIRLDASKRTGKRPLQLTLLAQAKPQSEPEEQADFLDTVRQAHPEADV